MFKSLIPAVVIVSALAAPTFAFAQSTDNNGPLTRAEVKAQLVQLEKAGYNPAGDQIDYPANIQARVATVLSVINNHTELESTAQASQSALSVIADYAPPINDMIALNNLIAEGTSDASLVSDVQTLNSLSLAKDQAAQQRALLFNAFRQKIFADGEQQALTTAESQELVEETALRTTATPAEQSTFNNTVAGPLFNQAQEIEIYVEGLPLGTISLDVSFNGGHGGVNAVGWAALATLLGKEGLAHAEGEGQGETARRCLSHSWSVRGVQSASWAGDAARRASAPSCPRRWRRSGEGELPESWKREARPAPPWPALNSRRSLAS